jgi:hypothetical protein
MVSAAWLIGALAAVLLPVVAHPTHTSTAELVSGADSVHVAIRVFADDIATVGAVRPYLGDRFGILDRGGRSVPLEWAGSALAGGVLTMRLRGRVAGGLAGARVSNRVLTDRFDDQVNVVRAAYDRRVATLIFVRGDGPKALP